MKNAIAVALICAIVTAVAWVAVDHNSDAWNYGRCGECGHKWTLKTLIEGGEYEYWCESGHAFTTKIFRGWAE